MSKSISSYLLLEASETDCRKMRQLSPRVEYGPQNSENPKGVAHDSLGQAKRRPRFSVSRFLVDRATS